MIDEVVRGSGRVDGRGGSDDSDGLDGSVGDC